jgi:tRNA (guanine-N7-)-methyltransferase
MHLDHKLLKQQENHLYREDFSYTSKNPYHYRLEIFKDFVLRDEEAENFKNLWNSQVFENSSELYIEIGTGYGEFMMEYTQKNPHINFVGLDHRFKRSYHVAQKLSQMAYKNFRYLRARGERLAFLFGSKEVSRVFYFFPDPWPKTRHHKKRLFQKKFLDDCFKVLTQEGEIWIKTDHLEYFQWMLEVISNEKKAENRYELVMQTQDLYREFPTHELAQFQTKFEKIFLEKNTKIKSLILKKINTIDF